MAFEWSEEKCFLLISAVREQRVLWDPKDPKKKNKNAKKDAFASVAAKLQTSANEVSMKWKNLAQSYRVYRRKCRKTTTGMGTDQLYKPTWFAFDALNDFMNDVYTPQATIDTMGDEQVSVETNNDEDSDYHDAEYHEDNPSSVETATKEAESVATNTEDASTSNAAISQGKSPAKKLFKSPRKCVKASNKGLTRKNQEDDPRVAEAYDYLRSRKEKEESARSKQEKSECDLFGEYIASKLKKENAETQEIMMQEIHQLIFNIKRRKIHPSPYTSPYTQHSAHYNSATQAQNTFLGMQSPATEHREFHSHSVPSPTFSASLSPMSTHSFSNPPTPSGPTFSFYPMSSATDTSGDIGLTPHNS